MTSDLRIVFDTSVIVSAVLLPRSIPRRAFDQAQDEGKVLISEETVDELNTVLRRDRFERYVTAIQRLEFLAELIEKAEWVHVTAVVFECRDPKDNKFLELAISGRATHLISGDKDLLVLHPFRGIQIVTPQVFLTRDKKET